MDCRVKPGNDGTESSEYMSPENTGSSDCRVKPGNDGTVGTHRTHWKLSLALFISSMNTSSSDGSERVHLSDGSPR